MYGLAGTLVNTCAFQVVCAYSGPNPSGGAHLWHVSTLNPGWQSDGIDIDYIRPSNNKNYLCWAGGFGGVVKNPAWKTNGWVKLRQLVTTTIEKDAKRPSLGFLACDFVLWGKPNPALSEAKKYDGGRDEAARGTAAVKAAIAEWEEKIGSGAFTDMAQRGAS